jgi:hypothetical protein
VRARGFYAEFEPRARAYVGVTIRPADIAAEVTVEYFNVSRARRHAFAGVSFCHRYQSLSGSVQCGVAKSCDGAEDAGVRRFTLRAQECTTSKERMDSEPCRR